MKFVLVAVVLFTAVPAFAQDEERRGFIGLGIGPSAPFGDFVRAGRASPGYTSTLLNVGYRFAERVGVAGAFFYAEYNVDGEGDDDWYQVAGLTAGPMYSHRISARAALDLKAMFGLIALTPVVDSYSTADGTGSGFGIDMRAAVRYDIFRRWALFAEGGIQSSAVSFSTGTRNDFRAIISGFGFAFRPAW